MLISVFAALNRQWPHLFHKLPLTFRFLHRYSFCIPRGMTRLNWPGSTLYVIHILGKERQHLLDSTWDPHKAAHKNTAASCGWFFFQNGYSKSVDKHMLPVYGSIFRRYFFFQKCALRLNPTLTVNPNSNPDPNQKHEHGLYPILVGFMSLHHTKHSECWATTIRPTMPHCLEA